MNVKQAATKWEVTEYMVRKICKYKQINTKNIPEETIPVYLPDGRYKNDPFRYYVFVLDVIINTHMELEGIDPDIVSTCVMQLHSIGLIILKHGKAEDSVDYHDYMISPNREIFYNWKSAKMKNKIEMITPIVSAVTQGATTAGSLMATVGAIL